MIVNQSRMLCKFFYRLRVSALSNLKLFNFNLDYLFHAFETTWDRPITASVQSCFMCVMPS